MQRLLIALTCLALLAACATATPTPAPTRPPSPTATPAPAQPTATAAPAVLKLEGPGGTKSLTLDAIKALPVAEGWAGIKSSTGRITVPEPYKGVALNELCKLVGGLTPRPASTWRPKTAMP